MDTQIYCTFLKYLIFLITSYRSLIPNCTSSIYIKIELIIKLNITNLTFIMILYNKS